MWDGDQSQTGGVVDIQSRRQTRLDPQVARVERYWREVRGTRLVPTRADIDPRGLTGSLANAFVLERIATGLARFRIAGSHITDLMGLEVKGMPLSTAFVPSCRQTLADAIESAFDDPSIIRLHLSAETGFGKPRLEGDMVLLPLRSDLGEISRILGGVLMRGDTGRTPRRLQIESQFRDGLTGIGQSVDTTVLDDPMNPTKQGAAGPKRSHVRESAHLRLVVDNAE